MKLFSQFKFNNKLNESGNISFLVVIVLPLSITFTILTFDLIRWQTLKQNLQTETDRISLLAAKSLPDKGKAREIIEKNILNLSSELPNINYDLDITSNKISLSSSANLSSYINKINSEIFLAKQYTSLRVSKEDVVLIIPDSSSLKPKAYEAWGDSITWPAASYFQRVSLPCNNSNNLGENISEDFLELNKVCNQNLEDNFRRWATQNCFNPVLSKIKEISISASSFILSYEQNRLSVFFTPGELEFPGFYKAKDLSKKSPGTGNNHWSTYYDVNSQLGDESCIYFSDTDISLSDEYRAPKLTNNLLNQNNEAQIFLQTFPINPPVHTFQQRISNSYLSENLNFKDLIFYRRARERKVDDNSFISSLESATCEITEGCGTEAILAANNLNGDELNLLANKKIIILSDYVPALSNSSFKNYLEKLSNLNIKLYIFLFKHIGQEPLESSQLEDRASELFNSKKETDKYTVFLSESPAKLQIALETKLPDILLEYEISK